MTSGTIRAADLVCVFHQQVAVTTRMWPAGYRTCPSCQRLDRATPKVEIPLLPHLDINRCVAIHEAGHAVAYVELGVPIHYASLTPAADVAYPIGGHVSVALPPDEYRPVALWAGTSALLRFMHQAGTPTVEDLVDLANNGSGDAEQLRSAGLSHADLIAARDRADDLTERRWHHIERVADALMERGRLTGREITELTAPKPAEPDGQPFRPVPKGCTCPLNARTCPAHGARSGGRP